MKPRNILSNISVKADASGNIPTSIHFMSTGHWHAPWHGNFEMDSTDLAEMVANFDNGVAMVEGSKKLPINYGHDMGGKAAGWITKLYVSDDGQELWGDVEWTPSALKALKDGEYCYISPEWNPRSFPYQDPEDEESWLDNVFTGAGLTNIPLFKKLKPIMASIVTGGSRKASNTRGGDMNLEQVRVKKLEELNDEEKAFLEEHKAELTDDERTALGLVVDGEGGEDDPQDDPDDTPPADPTPSGDPVKASAGSVSISASELASLKAAAQAGAEANAELRRNRLTASAEKAITRGALKSDQLKDTVELLMASTGKQEAAILNFIENLPDNKVMASEAGEAGGDASAHDQLFDKAKSIMASEKVNVDVAMKLAREQNPDLARAFDASLTKEAN